MITLQSLKLDVANNRLKIAAVIDGGTNIPYAPTKLNINTNTILQRNLDVNTETQTTYNPEAIYAFRIVCDESVVSESVIGTTITVNDNSMTVGDFSSYVEAMFGNTVSVETTETSSTSFKDIDARFSAIEDGATIIYQLGSVSNALLEEYQTSYGTNAYTLGTPKIDDKFANCYFKGIYIDTQDSFICTNEPSDIAKNDGKDIPLTDHCKAINPDTNGNIDLTSFIRDFDVKNDMFFVFLEADPGNTDVSGWTDAEKQSTVVGIIFSKVELQKTVFNQIKNVACQDKCNTTCQDVLPILWYKAFQLSGTGDLVKDSIKYWKLIHNNNITTTNNCSCNG